MASPILIIDPGHGGIDPGGGTNRYWKEKDLALKISLYQYNRYKELGVPVAITRTTDKTLSPDERTRIVRSSGARYCHSNHLNAGGGDGAEVIHSIYDGKDMAEKIAQELRRVGQNIRRVFTRTMPGNSSLDYYFMIRETGSVVTNIIEYGFADSPGDDINQLRNNHLDYAEAVVKAFCEYAGYTYRSPSGDVGHVNVPINPPSGGGTGGSGGSTESTGQYIHLPASENSWRVYPLNVAPVRGNEKGFLNPAKFGGLTYEILGNPQAHVYTIETSDFGKVKIYGHPSTGATINKTSGTQTGSNPQPSSGNTSSSTGKHLHLPSSETSWRVYPLGVSPVKGNEVGFLNPAKFGGLSYEILGNTQAHVYIIETSDFDRVQIYAHPSTGATISDDDSRAPTSTLEKPGDRYLRLPAAESSWRVYPLNKAPVKGNEKGFLNPKKFGGLTYKILGTTQANVYIIETADFGRVQIYAHPNTGATITNR
ncbi:N-acetylmuramoyl-L-alanine amidase family protein [Ornithinibacillus californiensis]|uniref:N-acetylmuramoyl-L-alanine amidase family protein n=1 Tax=Ornithinibacillus californiensis TaxID=161536 RepID=UPI00069DB856|nr:N-acetylmuramoyl-L-alanine amidase [Ornithinibacillus californiensis]